MTQLFGNAANNEDPSRATDQQEEQRRSAAEVDYMELPGAQKDADCGKVEVPGGVSRHLGCCNDFQYNTEAEKRFSCGTCKFLIGHVIAA